MKQVNWKNELERKHLLLDTGILLRAFKNEHEGARFFNDLQEANCTPVSFSFIEFEFMRQAGSEEHVESRKEFWNNLDLPPLPSRHSDKDLIPLAINIAHEYGKRQHRSASLIDCTIAALAARHPKDLCIATMNLQDFPHFLFDIIHLYPIKDGKVFSSIAFLKIREDQLTFLHK